MTTTKSGRWTIAALSCLVLGLTGCGAATPAVAPAASTAAMPAEDGSGTMYDKAPADGGAVGGLPGGVPAEVPGKTDRQIARNGSLTVAVKDVILAAGQLTDLATAVGGLVTSESLRTDATETDQVSRIVLSVPASKLDQFMNDAAKVGELKLRSTNAADVTMQLVDVESRIRTLRESIARIRLLMDRTGSIAAIAQVEAELTSRQTELESTLAQQAALKDQVAMSPVSVTLIAPGQAAPSTNPFLNGLTDGWTALLKSLNVLLVAAGALLPFAVLAALVIWPLMIWRRRTRASRPTPGFQPAPYQPTAPAPGPEPAPAPAPAAPQPSSAPQNPSE